MEQKCKLTSKKRKNSSLAKKKSLVGLIPGFIELTVSSHYVIGQYTFFKEMALRAAAQGPPMEKSPLN